MGSARHPDLKDVPNAVEFAADETAKRSLEFLFSQLSFGRPVFGPPGLPPDWLTAAQIGFQKTMQDPEFVQEARKLNLETRWFGADRMVGIMKSIDIADESIRASMRAILNVN